MATLTAPDGTQLVYDAYEPTSPRAALLFLHGWSDHAGRWVGVCERLQVAGYAVYALDQRGHGRSGGRRGHLSRFSQLLGDLQAFRRAVRRRRPELRQVLLGHSFGGLVTLRYLETQPGDPVVAAVLSSPWLALAASPPKGKIALARLLADLWPTFPLPIALDAGLLSRDPATTRAYASDSSVQRVMTPGAWREIQWAQRAVPADAARVDVPVLFLLAGHDQIVSADAARTFAAALEAPVDVRWYPDLFHEVLHEPEREQVVADLMAFLAQHGVA
jgi:alpha-beta hydrolase superfamily lysophospholipase